MLFHVLSQNDFCCMIGLLSPRLNCQVFFYIYPITLAIHYRTGSYNVEKRGLLFDAGHFEWDAVLV